MRSPIILLLLVASLSTADVHSKTKVETTGYRLDYYARLDENLVHALSVKRMWSRTRLDILDKKSESKGNHVLEGHINEHDPTEKKKGLLELTNQFTVMAATEMFKKIFANFPRKDQLWILDRKNLGSFPDLNPDCNIDYSQKSKPIVCSIEFHSLQMVYASYFELQVTMTTKPMDLSQEEKEERMYPSRAGTTKAIEHSNIKMDVMVVTPSRYTRTMNEYKIPLSADVLKHLEYKCNRFLATPLPIVNLGPVDSPDITVLDQSI